MRAFDTPSKPSEPMDNPLMTTVVEVLPETGIAWLQDAEEGEWVVTKSTPGVDVSALRPGMAVCVHWQEFNGHRLASRCS